MRKAVLLLLKVAVSGLLLYFALRNVNFVALKALLRETQLGWFALGLLLIIAQLMLLALRWRAIVQSCGSAMTLGSAVRFSMIGLFFNQALPSSIGGDAIRIWLFGKQENWRIAGYSVLIDRVVGVIALADLVLICLPWSFGLISDPYARGALLLIGLGANFAGLIFLALAYKPLRFLERWTVFRHLNAVAKVAVSIIKSPKAAANIIGLSVLTHLLSALVAWSITRSVGADIPLATLLFLVPPALLATVLPISIAGWGVRESAMVAAFAYAGLAENDGLVLSLLFGVQYLIVGLACGLLWIMPGNSARAGYSAATAHTG